MRNSTDFEQLQQLLGGKLSDRETAELMNFKIAPKSFVSKVKKKLWYVEESCETIIPKHLPNTDGRLLLKPGENKKKGEIDIESIREYRTNEFSKKMDRYIEAIIFGFHGIVGFPQAGYQLAKIFSEWRKRRRKARLSSK